MRQRVFLQLVISVALTTLPGMAALAECAEQGRIGCPRCKNDGSEASVRLQKADELYAAFKTKEALGELLKVLEIDPQNHEALSKISRSYVDFGDMIPE